MSSKPKLTSSKFVTPYGKSVLLFPLTYLVVNGLKLSTSTAGRSGPLSSGKVWSFSLGKFIKPACWVCGCDITADYRNAVIERMRTVRSHLRARSSLSIRGLQACPNCTSVIDANMRLERTRDQPVNTCLVLATQVEEFVLPPEKPLERPRVTLAKRSAEQMEPDVVDLTGSE